VHTLDLIKINHKSPSPFWGILFSFGVKLIWCDTHMKTIPVSARSWAENIFTGRVWDLDANRYGWLPKHGT
jgi:hypothetical protein